MDGANSVDRRKVIREFNAVRNAEELLAKAFEQIAAGSSSSSPQAGAAQPQVHVSIDPELSETCT